ncbi:MAG: hypothetical protein ACK56I_37240, partial [bacterium]
YLTSFQVFVGEERLLHASRRLEVPLHPMGEFVQLPVERFELGIPGREFFLGQHQVFIAPVEFLVFLDGVLEDGDEQVEGLLPPGANFVDLSSQSHRDDIR